MEKKNQNIEEKKDLTQEEIEEVQGGKAQQQQRGSDYYRDGKVVEMLNNHGQAQYLVNMRCPKCGKDVPYGHCPWCS